MTMSARHVPFVLAALLCGVCVAAAAEAGAESSSIAANVVGNEDKAATDALKKVVEVAKAAGVSATKAALLSRSAHASLSSSSTGLGEAFSAVGESTLSSKLDEAKEKTNKGKQAAELAKEATAAALEEAKKALASVAAAVQSVGKEVQWYKVGSGGMKDTNASDKAKELMAKAAATAQKALVKAKEMHTRFQQALSYGNTAVGLNNAAVEQATKADNEAQALKTNTDITTTLGSGDLKEKISSAQRIAIGAANSATAAAGNVDVLVSGAAEAETYAAEVEKLREEAAREAKAAREAADKVVTPLPEPRTTQMAPDATDAILTSEEKPHTEDEDNAQSHSEANVRADVPSPGDDVGASQVAEQVTAAASSKPSVTAANVLRGHIDVDGSGSPVWVRAPLTPLLVVMGALACLAAC